MKAVNNINNSNSNSLTQYATRRSFSSSSSPSDAPSPLRSLLWLSFHALCCLVSLVLGFRFSRLLLFLLLSHPSSPQSPSNILNHYPFSLTTTTTSNNNNNHQNGSRVVVGRHGILIRPWPHPDPTEVLTAHAIIERVQREQRLQYGVKNPRRIIAVTPTHSRTFQTLYLTAIVHSLLLLPYDLTWIVVDASPPGAPSNETASFLYRSGLRDVLHLQFPQRIPPNWPSRHRTEARMRLLALREIRERRLDGVVVFLDDSNMHSMEMFDEVQQVKWFGVVSVGILSHSGNPDLSQKVNQMQQGDVVMGGKRGAPVPVQGPACNSSGHLVGWHTFNTLPYSGKSASYVGDVGVVLPSMLEWSGFVLNSRVLWKDEEERPEWVRDLDELKDGGEGLESPLGLLKDASFIEPLGNCGKKVMLWWLRVEARLDSKFPPGWIIDPPLEITVAAKRTPWPDVPPELPLSTATGHAGKHPRSRSARSRRSSRSKRRREQHVDTLNSGASRTQTQH